jgi:outer membrane protein TolC
MNLRGAFLVGVLFFGWAGISAAQDGGAASVSATLQAGSASQARPAAEAGPAAVPRAITLQEAVQMALEHNHLVRIAGFKVDELQHAKEVARSGYFPTLDNQSTVLHVTDLQHVIIPEGAFGNAGGGPIPAGPITLLQGGQTFETSGTQLSQPLTPLLKVQEQNAIARADVNAGKAQSENTRNQVALTVHQLYYRILVAQVHRAAVEARIQAAQDLQGERADQLKAGSALEQDVLESRAQALQARQDLLSTDLQLSDSVMQLDDLIGLPLSTPLALSAAVPASSEVCPLEECEKMAVESHPEVLEAQQQLEKAQAAVRLAKRDFIPDTEVFARYSYQNNVPFFAHNFGTFGFIFTYDIFDGGRKGATLGERKSQTDEARENLERVKDEVELGVQAAYNKLDRTREMVAVSESLLALRQESGRVIDRQMQQGAALPSQASAAHAQALEAQATLLQSQLDYLQAQDEMTVAIGKTPE